jgi:tripartite-type tricarboxylate transporter receptor subunit TctC
MSDAPLTLVIGFSAGSASDDIAHLIATPLGAALGRRVVIERIAGDNGARAAQAVARAAPDGNTLLVATLGTHALAPHVHHALPYHPLRDFAAVSLLTQAPMLLACHPALPVDDVQDLIAQARARPGTLAYGTSATGGAPHLAAALFESVAGVKLRHARYDETQKLYADLEDGRIALSFNNIMSMLPRCNAGELRALGVTSAQRSPVAPHIATLAECGVHEYEMSNWVGLVAPTGTPQAVVERLSGAVAGVMRETKVFATLNAAGITSCGTAPAAFAQFIEAQLQRWKPIASQLRAEN